MIGIENHLKPTRRKCLPGKRWPDRHRSLSRQAQLDATDDRGLLDAVIAKAREAKVQVLHGAVVRGDLDPQPWLLSFYERRGFLVLPPTEEEMILPAEPVTA